MVTKSFEKLIFGAVDSSNYGVYISGDGVFNAPERAVELVSVPGRNGAVIVDQGHWENVEVEYHAGMYGVDPADFARKLTEFRNALKSQIGYQRLQDTYHPEQYRMATFIDSFEVDPASMTQVGEFTLKFNCKPQRWLTSGESETAFTLGQDPVHLYNPTLYDSSPLIEVGGSGTLFVEDYHIEVEDATMGNIILLQNVTSNLMSALTEPLGAAGVAEDGDTITVNLSVTYGGGSKGITVTSVTVSNPPPIGTASFTLDIFYWTRIFFKVDAVINFTKGTGMDLEFPAEYTVVYNKSGTSYTTTVKIILAISYDDTSDTITLGAQYIYLTPNLGLLERELKFSSVSVESTKSILGNPTYIDCDLGECYKIENGEVVDLNAYIDLGSDLPVLKPGDNTISYDNSVTSLKIVPRWWML